MLRFALSFVGLFLSAPAPSTAWATKLFEQASPWPVPTAAQLRYGGKMSALIHFNMASEFSLRDCRHICSLTDGAQR